MTSISLKNLKKEYKNGKSTIPVLKNISVDFPDTGIIGLLGKNGAGKTTLIKSCVNLISYSGSISYFGKDLQSISKQHTHYYTALFEGNRNIYWKLTPLENIKYFAGLRGIEYSSIKEYTFELLTLFELENKTNNLVESLSRGMQQKVALVIALSFNTPIVYLDEPTLGLDIETRNSLINFFVKNNHIKKQLLVISSHDLDFIMAACDTIYLLQNGQLHEYNSNLIQPRFRIKSKTKIFSLESLEFIKEEDNYFYYDFDLEAINPLSILTNKERDNIISITNLKYDLEQFYYKSTDQNKKI